MSTDRLDELGVPRRAFLKKAAAAAIAAPVIVSFGMDAVAESAPTKPKQCHPNQSIPNQIYQPSAAYNRILQAILLAASEFASPRLSFAEANSLAVMTIDAELMAVAGNLTQASQRWGLLIAHVKQSHTHISAELAEEIIGEAERAQSELNCE